MAKKIFFVLLIVLMLEAIYVIYQKKNPTVNQPTGTINQPTSIVLPHPSSPKAISLEINQPINNSTVSNAVITLTGKTISNGSVSIDDQDLKADVNGNFSTTVTLDEGQNDIYVVVSDDLGNSVEKDVIVNLESTQ